MAIDQKVGLLSGAAQALQTDAPVDTVLDKEEDGEDVLVEDGSGQAYIWRNRDGVLFTHRQGDFVDPFFYSVDNAERAMQRWDDELGADLSGSKLYKIYLDKKHTITEYEEVVTDETSLGDYL
jgi:hypothetical protein